MSVPLPHTGVLVPSDDWTVVDLHQALTGQGGVAFHAKLARGGDVVGTFDCRGDGYPTNVRIDDADHRSAWRAWVAALDAIEQPGPGLIGSGEESAIEALIAETEAAEAAS